MKELLQHPILLIVGMVIAAIIVRLIYSGVRWLFADGESEDETKSKCDYSNLTDTQLIMLAVSDNEFISDELHEELLRRVEQPHVPPVKQPTAAAEHSISVGGDTLAQPRCTCALEPVLVCPIHDHPCGCSKAEGPCLIH